MPDIHSPSRRREGARAALRELVRTASAVVEFVPREAEFPRRRLQSVLSRLHSLAGPLEDATSFDDAFRDPIPDPIPQATSAAERDEARLHPSEVSPDTLSRLLHDAEALEESRIRQEILEARLAEAADRESGLYDGKDMFERLRINERRPMVEKSKAMDPHHLRHVIASLDAAGMTKAAETLIWAAWHYERAHAKATATVVRIEHDPVHVRIELQGGGAHTAGPATGDPVPTGSMADPRSEALRTRSSRADQAL